MGSSENRAHSYVHEQQQVMWLNNTCVFVPCCVCADRNITHSHPNHVWCCRSLDSLVPGAGFKSICREFNKAGKHTCSTSSYLKKCSANTNLWSFLTAENTTQSEGLTSPEVHTSNSILMQQVLVRVCVCVYSEHLVLLSVLQLIQTINIQPHDLLLLWWCNW